jgi:hypothetical protein
MAGHSVCAAESSLCLSLLHLADCCFPPGTKDEGAKLVDAWVRLGFRKEMQVAPDGGARRDTEAWQQILALRLD